MDKVIVTAAITGSIHTPSMSEYLPITPDEIVAEAIRSYDAGAAAAHIHVRDPETGKPSSDVELYREVATKIKDKCDIILTITTGGGMGMSAEERVAPIPKLKPEMATFNFGTFNFSFSSILESYNQFKYEWERPFIEMSEEYTPTNSFKTLKTFAHIFEENDTKPELEIYDVGMLNNVAHFIEKGYIKKPVYIQFVLGILGGLPATVSNLVFLHNSAMLLFGEDFAFSVCAAGKNQFPMCTQSLLLKGNVRVGLEDNLFLDKNVFAKSNAEQVTKVIKIARELGIDPASPSEARKILGLKGIEWVCF